MEELEKFRAHPTTAEQETEASRLGQEMSEDRFYEGFMDEMRVTLEGPDRRSCWWISNQRFTSCWEGEGGYCKKLIGPFWIEDGLKINFRTCC